MFNDRTNNSRNPALLQKVIAVPYLIIAYF